MSAISLWKNSFGLRGPLSAGPITKWKIAFIPTIIGKSKYVVKINKALPL
jgi:hypothetical protein